MKKILFVFAICLGICCGAFGMESRKEIVMYEDEDEEWQNEDPKGCS